MQFDQNVMIRGKWEIRTQRGCLPLFVLEQSKFGPRFTDRQFFKFELIRDNGYIVTPVQPGGLYYGDADIAEMDESRMLPLPQSLVMHLAARKSEIIIVVGMLTYFEIFSTDAWREVEQDEISELSCNAPCPMPKW